MVSCDLLFLPMHHVKSSDRYPAEQAQDLMYMRPAPRGALRTFGLLLLLCQ